VGLGALFGGDKPTTAPRGDGTASNCIYICLQKSANYEKLVTRRIVVVAQSFTSFGVMESFKLRLAKTLCELLPQLKMKVVTFFDLQDILVRGLQLLEE